MRIEDLRSNINDNAKHFADFPEAVFFDDLAEHIGKLPGCEITEYEVDGVIGVWIEFNYLDQHFFVDALLACFKFYVEDPKCDESILRDVIDHLTPLFETALRNDE